ncbi:MAG: hypothetical protein LBN10_12105 [Propionibacteriaceae bacterium]|jgi:hypothetical protein|nr:hypothetical protein [Propionibacteriaceae bacterium]
MDEFDAIIAAEFGESKSPAQQPAPIEPAHSKPSPPDSTAPIPEEGKTAPTDDFHLNLYDDDESYREVATDAWALGPLAGWGVTAITAGIVVAILRLTMAGPGWLGWVTGALVMCGIGLCIAQAVTGPRDEDSDGGVV